MAICNNPNYKLPYIKKEWSNILKLLGKCNQWQKKYRNAYMEFDIDDRKLNENLKNQAQFQMELEELETKLKNCDKKCVIFAKTSVGKSTVINNLLGRDILPTGAGRVSKKIVRISISSHNKKESINGNEMMDINQLSFLNDDKAMNSNKEIKVCLRPDKVKPFPDNVTICDTPGICDDKEMEDLVANEFRTADLIILLLDGQAGINSEAKKRLKSILINFNVIVVYNKWDLVVENDDAVKVMIKHKQATQEFLETEMKMNIQNIDDVIHFISSKRYKQIRGLMCSDTIKSAVESVIKDTHISYDDATTVDKICQIYKESILQNLCVKLKILNQLINMEQLEIKFKDLLGKMMESIEKNYECKNCLSNLKSNIQNEADIKFDGADELTFPKICEIYIQNNLQKRSCECQNIENLPEVNSASKNNFINSLETKLKKLFIKFITKKLREHEYKISFDRLKHKININLNLVAEENDVIMEKIISSLKSYSNQLKENQESIYKNLDAKYKSRLQNLERIREPIKSILRDNFNKLENELNSIDTTKFAYDVEKYCNALCAEFQNIINLYLEKIQETISKNELTWMDKCFMNEFYFKYYLSTICEMSLEKCYNYYQQYLSDCQDKSGTIEKNYKLIGANIFYLQNIIYNVVGCFSTEIADKSKSSESVYRDILQQILSSDMWKKFTNRFIHSFDNFIDQYKKLTIDIVEEMKNDPKKKLYVTSWIKKPVQKFLNSKK